MDVTITDNEQTTPNQQETIISKVTTAIAAADFNHQFNTDKRRNNKPKSTAPITGANRQ
jgi:hypothetical protein